MGLEPTTTGILVEYDATTPPLYLPTTALHDRASETHAFEPPHSSTLNTHTSIRSFFQPARFPAIESPYVGNSNHCTRLHQWSCSTCSTEPPHSSALNTDTSIHSFFQPARFPAIESPYVGNSNHCTRLHKWSCSTCYTTKSAIR